MKIRTIHIQAENTDLESFAAIIEVKVNEELGNLHEHRILGVQIVPMRVNYSNYVSDQREYHYSDSGVVVAITYED